MNDKKSPPYEATVTFSYDDNQRAEEIIALKTLLFSLLRNLPHDVAIKTLKSINKKNSNSSLDQLRKEMVDAIISSSDPEMMK